MRFLGIMAIVLFALGAIAAVAAALIRGTDGQPAVGGRNELTVFVAVLGLAGVLVGAGITAGTNYLLAGRRERAENERERRTHATEVKRAARLIDAELAG